ncbi:polysaccharide export protein EpsE [Ideonella sp.]|uniref:polysaccharide export protein EpsE n=1 Tax=Ideonella sp. TaxID=1929293 RepID=UPI002B474E5C|nr:polysaccharide export protein EpsE [Ideonella sp.]HJV70892.1 polysaccharide export protein EpsE [Ideonella sp.]
MNDRMLGWVMGSRLALAAGAWVLAAGLAAAPVPASAQAAQAAATNPDLYRIGAGDTVRITVYQSPDLTLEAKVTEAGVISYPLIGAIRLGGLTVSGAEAALAAALKKGDFIKNPQVTVMVTQVRANQVNVLGQVGRPGRVPLDVAGMRLTDVIALAGGIAASAGSDTVVVTGTRNGQAFRLEVDLPRVFAPGGRDNDIVIQPGDAIWVDRYPVVYLYGEVQRPGQLRLERGMTVMQALASAGGLTQRGTQRGLRVSRRAANGQVQSLELSMDDALQPGDVVFVRESLF